MKAFRLKDEQPPAPKPVSAGVVTRLEHIYEVAPESMTLTQQQDMPVWDSQRIVASRWEHLRWMHEHWADTVLSGEEILKRIEGRYSDGH